MIIFDLEGVLANCEHRRPLVDPTLNIDYILQGYDGQGKIIEEKGVYTHILTGKRFKPLWKSFHEACDKDSVIEPTKIMYEKIAYSPFSSHVEIWTGRCESQREKTLKWIIENFYWSGVNENYLSETLIMRPIGDNIPLHELKEKWFDEYMDSKCPKLPPASQETDEKIFTRKNPLDFVFESDVASMAMWNRRGIFVFDCNQRDKGF